MLTSRQIWILAALALAFWIVATLSIRWSAGAIVNPLRGALMFAVTLPVGWLSVRLTRRAASLAPDQLLAGVTLAGALAMLIDGAVLHWAPQVYGQSELVVRLGSAWLLWGYGVSFAIAFFMSGPPIKRPR
jgi:hypothetical protein